LFGFGADMIFSIASLTVKLAALARGGNSFETLQSTGDQGLGRHKDERAMREPVGVLDAVRPALEWVGTQVVNLGRSQSRELS
jgi:hypothetical protein